MLSAWLWSFAFQKGQAGLQCGSPLGSPRLLWGVGGCRRGRAGGGGGAGDRVRGAVGAAGLPPPEPFRSAEPGARTSRLAEPSAGTAAPQIRGAPGRTLLACGALGSVPYLPGSLLWDSVAAFLEVIWALPSGRSTRGLPGWQGATLLSVEMSPRFRVYMESGVWQG